MPRSIRSIRQDMAACSKVLRQIEDLQSEADEQWDALEACHATVMAVSGGFVLEEINLNPRSPDKPDDTPDQGDTA